MLNRPGKVHKPRLLPPSLVKTLDQHNLAAMHRMRAGWISIRVQQINLVRAILREINLVIPQGARWVAPQVHEWFSDDSIQIAETTRILLFVALAEIGQLEHR
ncbi:MAG: hypothetical protein VYE73_08910 [Acidobacteriota bacterium]|nr:hypothetical protein [Acidobacteriota bacterium]